MTDLEMKSRRVQMHLDTSARFSTWATTWMVGFMVVMNINFNSSLGALPMLIAAIVFYGIAFLELRKSNKVLKEMDEDLEQMKKNALHLMQEEGRA